MALDPRLILAGQSPDTLGAFTGGLQAGAMQNQIGRQNALADLYRTQGAGIMAGETGALNALAGLDPMAAMDVQKGRLGMRIADQRMSMLSAQERRQAEEYARGLSAQQAAAEAQKLEDAVKMGMMIPDAATWDAQMSRMAPELVGQFGQRQALAAKFMSMAEVLKQAFPEAPKPMSSPGKVQADINAGFLPQGTPLQSPSTQVTVNGENSGAFKKKADETAATRLNSIVEAGQSAQAFIGDMQALASLAGQINTGKGAEITAALGPWAEMAGVKIDGLSEMQAFDAIRDRLVPQMRPPGSGAASDFDARQFLSSLPSLARTPEGNAMINDTLQALYQHRVAAAEIANQAFSEEISWQEADRRISALGNPYEAFNKSRDKIQSGAAAAGAVAPKPAARPMPSDFGAKYGDIARQYGVTVEQLWENWPND